MKGRLLLKQIVLALSTLLLLGLSAQAQYGGPPMWSRDQRDWGPNERERRLPPPRHYGPQMEPCIYNGDCRGPRYRVPRPRYPERDGPGDEW